MINAIMYMILKYFILPIMAILLISIVVGIVMLIKGRKENE
jgi:hypothetical protein